MNEKVSPFVVRPSMTMSTIFYIAFASSTHTHQPIEIMTAFQKSHLLHKMINVETEWDKEKEKKKELH